VERTGPYPFVQPSAQRHGTMRVDFAGQPQASPDQQRQGYPHDAPLDLDAALVSLHLPQGTQWRDQRLLHRPSLDTNALPSARQSRTR
jgi:hypothetical protein